MSKTPLTHIELSEDDARDLIAMFDRARTPEQFRTAMQIAKMRERSHRAATRASQRKRGGLIATVAAIPSQLRSQSKSRPGQRSSAAPTDPR
jgi:hypothetical protein